MRAPAKTPRRKPDPQRRLRIVEAALDVIAERGIEGLTHRAVAERADVPLAATTYYFTDKEDLLASSVELAGKRNVASTRLLLGELLERYDLAGALAALVDELTRNRRLQQAHDYHIYLAALTRPALRDKSRVWAQAYDEFVYERTDHSTGHAVVYALDGMLIRAAVTGVTIDRAEAEPVFRRIIDGGPRD
jgi:DNA-binding transcriptional regulator YbjK